MTLFQEIEFKKYLGLLVLFIVVGALIFFFTNGSAVVENPITIGFIHSSSKMGLADKSYLIDAVNFAVKEINQRGGVLGRPLVVRVIDSEGPSFEESFESLIRNESINVFFGCLTSACLAKVKPVLEQQYGLLFFPASYEGFEQSSNVIYLGAVPNQQIIPGVRWAIDHIGGSFYMIGSNNTRSLVAHQMAQDLAKVANANIVGESLISNGDAEIMREIFIKKVKEIQKLQPKFIFSTLDAENNKNFMMEVSKAGLGHIPVLFLNLNQEQAIEVSQLNIKNIYTLDSYYQDFPTDINNRFVSSLRRSLNKQIFVNPDMENIYNSIYLWADTVKQKKSLDPLHVNTETLLRQTFPGPSGIVSIDSMNRHAWKFSMVLQLTASGSFKMVDRSPFPLKPSPWPVYRTRDEWSNIIKIKQKNQEIFE